MLRGNASSMSPPVGSGTSSSKVRNRNASSQGRKSQTGTRSCHRPAIVLWHAGQLLEPVLPWPPSGPVSHGATERGGDELMPTDTRPLCDVDVFDRSFYPVSYTHLRAHETVLDLVCRLLLEKKKKNKK